MSTTVLWAAAAAGLAAALALPARSPTWRLPGHRGPGVDPGPGAVPGPDDDGPARWVHVLVGLAVGAFVWLLLGGLVGAVVGSGAGVWLVRSAARLTTARERARRAEAAADLPALVGLFAAGLRAGAPTMAALDRACVALPGAAADGLAPVRARLHLGVPPPSVWAELAGDEALAPLGRALARAHRTGAPVAAVVDGLAEELASQARTSVEDRARAVGVRAALPLGLCLLPGFLLLGIVPLVAALVGGLVW